MKGIGPITLPISQGNTRRLAAVARPARYGLKDQTRFDSRIRDTGEIVKRLITIDQSRRRSPLEVQKLCLSSVHGYWAETLSAQLLRAVRVPGDWSIAHGTLMNASIPFHDTTPNVQDLSRHPVMVRIGSGDVYEGTVLRFAPNIQVARDGRLGDRLIFDDKENFALRIGWAWNPGEKWSYRAGTGIFYMQDTGNPRFDMARNLSGRRRDNTLLLTPDLTLDAPFRGSGAANDCGVAPPLVCLTNIYVLGNMPDRKTPYMFQYLFNVQRELDGSTALEIGYLGSRSYRLERMFDWNETTPGLTGSVQSRKPYPEYTKVQEIGNVAEARYNSLAVKLTRRLHQGLSVLGGYALSKSTDNGSGIRTLNGDTLFTQNSNCLDCEWGLSVFDVRHRFVSSVLYELPFGNGKPFMQTGVGAAILGGWQISTIISKSSGFPRTAYGASCSSV